MNFKKNQLRLMTYAMMDLEFLFGWHGNDVIKKSNKKY